MPCCPGIAARAWLGMPAHPSGPPCAHPTARLIIADVVHALIRAGHSVDRELQLWRR